MINFYKIKKLKEVIALQGHDILESGTHKPQLIRGYCKSNNLTLDCVIKYMASERMGPDAAARELLAAFIAWVWDIKVVEPVIINVIPEFVETLKGSSSYDKAKNSLGINYGSVYLPGPKTLPITQKLNKFEIEDAQIIFAFDVLIGNSDRNFNKPNCMSDGHNIIIYDHELSFSFLHLIFPPKEPWIISDADKNWIDDMILKHKIKGKPLPKNSIFEKIEKLDENFWIHAFELIPEEWMTDQLNKIKNHIDLIVLHKNEFVKNINLLVP